MIQAIIDFFHWFGDTWNQIFKWVGDFFQGIVDWIDSLFSGIEWINSIALVFPAFQAIITTLVLAFTITIVLKVINR